MWEDPASGLTTKCWSAFISGAGFRNDTERLEKLFDLYSKMIAAEGDKAAKGKATNKAKAVS
jgi:hypothetical protein